MRYNYKDGYILTQHILSFVSNFVTIFHEILRLLTLNLVSFSWYSEWLLWVIMNDEKPIKDIFKPENETDNVDI